MLIKILINLILVLTGIITPFLLFEASLRTEHYVAKGIPFFNNPRDRWHQTLGWSGTEHVVGEQYKKNLLVIGDSFTEGLGIDSDKMWFASLRKKFPDNKIIAYGGLGYGTLQELIVLKEYLLKKTSPDFIVLQICSNDIINNYYELETNSYLQRAPAPRPYLIKDKIEVKFARKKDWLLYPIISFSRLAYRYNNKWDNRLAQLAQKEQIDTVENSIKKLGYNYQPFRDALQVTDNLFSEFKITLNGLKVIAVLVDDYEPYTSAFRDITRRHKIPLIIPFHDRVIPNSYRLSDGTHLNEDGNKLFGDLFIEQAQNKKLFNTNTLN